MEAARFPSVPLAGGHYESFYLRAGHPSEPLAAWIRYTVHKRPGAAPRGSVWFTLFDPATGPPRASKITLDELDTGDGWYIRVGANRFGPRGASGEARSERLDARWSLDIEPLAEPFEHLPRGWMYRTSLPRTKLVSPAPLARFRGRITVDERTIEVNDWRGMVGHNWGTEHAERWVWLHAAGFDGDPDAWLDVACGRVRLGPLTLPWIANGCLSHAGRRWRLGGVRRAAQVDARPGRCALVLPGAGGRVRATVSAELSNVVAWLYADPAGGERRTLNCSTAALELTLERADEPLTLTAGCAASYEFGLRGAVDGVETEPFPDG